jgi:hypothetical protein
MTTSADSAIPPDQEDLLAAIAAFIGEERNVLLGALRDYIAERLGTQAADLLDRMAAQDAQFTAKIEAMAAAHAASNARQLAVLADRREALHANTAAWMRRLIDTSPTFAQEP